MKSSWIAMVLAGLGLLLAGSLEACSGDQTSPDIPQVNDGDGGNNNGDGLVLCTRDEDCPAGQSCQDGVCATAGSCNCNYDCDKEAGQVCNQATHQCEPGAPPVNCQSDCDCFSGESCISNQCRPSGGDETPCSGDEDCPSGQTCQGGHCLPTNCSTREDCAGAICLICVQGECVPPPPVCQGSNDCCVGYYCNFGTCVPESTDECISDSDCQDAEFPRCVDGKCVQECVNDIDCPLPDQVCVDNHCVTPGCQPETCPQGTWCDTGDGQCKPGCDSNEDCTPPEACNYVTHQCGQVDCCGGCPVDKYCDTLTCQCVDMCGPTHPCPSGYTCEADGRCWCTEGACPAGSHCNTSTGQCEQDTVECNSSADCPSGWYCDTTTNTCVASSGGGHDGDFCFFDAQCDAAANFYCDNCIYCIIFDSSYEPTFTCREQCSVLLPNCPGGYDCYFVILKFMGLCLPPP